MTLWLWALSEEKEEQKNFRPGGRRNPLIRLNSDKENPSLSFDGLWPGLAGFG
jgi:hypothetical protein